MLRRPVEPAEQFRTYRSLVDELRRQVRTVSERLQHCFNDGRGGSGWTECGHEPCAESVSIVPTQIHLSIRTAANPARAVRRMRLNAIPLPQYWPEELRRAAAWAERPFSLAPFQDAHLCCGRAAGASQALVGHEPLPPAPVLGYSPTAIAGAET